MNGGPMMGLVFLKEEKDQNVLGPYMWRHNKMAISRGTEYVDTLILDFKFSASKTMSNKRQLFKPPCLWYFVIGA